MMKIRPPPSYCICAVTVLLRFLVSLKRGRLYVHPPPTAVLSLATRWILSAAPCLPPCFTCAPLICSPVLPLRSSFFISPLRGVSLPCPSVYLSVVCFVVWRAAEYLVASLSACGGIRAVGPLSLYFLVYFSPSAVQKGGAPSAPGGGSSRCRGQGGTGQQPAGHHEVLHGRRPGTAHRPHGGVSFFVVVHRLCRTPTHLGKVQGVI